jgi:protein involved in polysaccharide export with SLBB domain
MKFFKDYLFSFLAILALYSNAQAIDPSLLENLTPEQIKLAQGELNKTKPISGPKIDITESTVKNSINEKNKDNSEKFGYSFFSSVPTTISAVGDLPIPNDYKISLNDQLTVILSGSKELIFDLNVNLDGTILFPELGSIYVVGETFGDVKAKLRNLIKQSYIGVEIDLSLKNLSAKKITIVGAVQSPGSYLVNPFSTISSALAYSGGISEIGTLRNIKLIRNNGETFNFDLYKLLIEGDRSDDITIEAGDVILINQAEQFIKISGAVIRPSIYEVTSSETLGDLINFALGFKDIANKSNINLNVLDLNMATVNNINSSDLTLSLDDVLSVLVFSYVNKNTANISVKGSVNEPGFYSLEENPTLEKLINNLEFIDVYPWLGVLEQFDENNLIKSSTLFSLKDVSTYESISLLPNSKVYFANIDSRYFDVEESTQRKIEDFILSIKHKQTDYALPVYGKFSIKSFVDYLGLDMSDVDIEATYISPLESIVIKSDYREMEFTAKKYNTVTFRSPINDLINVEIRGEIDYPGIYTLESNATIQDLYEMVGNFKNEAYFKGIIFTRTGVRDRQLKAIELSKEQLNESLLVSSQKGDAIGDINIIKALSETIEPENIGRVAGDYSPNSLSSTNTIMFDGDSIFIPKNPYTINVFGEVLNPISFEYKKNMSVNDAIDIAGGYKEYAKKNGVYVIKANGITKKANRNIFVRNIKLEPGDSIVVPRKIITNNPGIQALIPITQILSDMAFSAAAIESLSNSNN